MSKGMELSVLQGAFHLSAGIDSSPMQRYDEPISGRLDGRGSALLAQDRGKSALQRARRRGNLGAE